ncbi:SIL1 factor, partial [Rostratula benghalensis]|nr:SIL1 factor [Rostratula benghalensis]
QAVPAGSHVRLNLQTGEREAKLPDSEKSDRREERRRRRYSVDVDSNSFTSQELKKALAKMKESEKAERKVRKQFPVRKKFRSIEQLKEEFEKLNMKVETDYEIMVKLISKFNSSASTLDEKAAALYDLEYYVHQV